MNGPQPVPQDAEMTNFRDEGKKQFDRLMQKIEEIPSIASQAADRRFDQGFAAFARRLREVEVAIVKINKMLGISLCSKDDSGETP